MTGDQRGLHDYLRDIRDACNAAAEFVAEMDYETFVTDLKTQYATTTRPTPSRSG
ncbi:hypothetical protein [Botrimarina sp.]|uniref:hypothetical protein n=1 Tax=Botrimarina sp. TaxID=2795802 RepID=UPI0032EB95DD